MPKPYTKKPINLLSVKALASRIEAIDRRIKKAKTLVTERRRLSARLMNLLKSKVEA